MEAGLPPPQLEDIRVRGWPVRLYLSFDPAFVTAHVADDTNIAVLIDFDGEFGWNWEQWGVVRLMPRARKIAVKRMEQRIEAAMAERRKRWRR